MKFKQQLWAVLLHPKAKSLFDFDGPTLAIEENSAPALFQHRDSATLFCRELKAQASLNGKVVRVKVTIKVKKGGRK
jgi:hypothetical protein